MHKGIQKKKMEPMAVNGRLTYSRLAHAGYVCEIDSCHPTFIRKNSYKNYTEPHHLVPIAYSDRFEVSLDVEENIISLCSNCHNQLHYGKNIECLLIKLFNDRKNALISVGINISFDYLLKMY